MLLITPDATIPKSQSMSIAGTRMLDSETKTPSCWNVRNSSHTEQLETQSELI